MSLVHKNLLFESSSIYVNNVTSSNGIFSGNVTANRFQGTVDTSSYSSGSVIVGGENRNILINNSSSIGNSSNFSYTTDNALGIYGYASDPTPITGGIYFNTINLKLKGCFDDSKLYYPSSGPYDALFAAIDASNPTLEYNALRELVNGNYVDGQAVTSATEWVSGVYNATQSIASAQPTFIESANGGLPAFRFAGGDYLDSSGPTLLQPNTILVVFSVSNGVNTAPFVFDGITGLGRHALYQNGAADPDSFAAFSGVTLAGGIFTQSTTFVVVIDYNGASSEIFVNGASVASGNAGAESYNRIRIGANYLTNNSLIGDVQLGPIIWDTPPTQAQIDAINTELQNLGYVTLA